VTKLGAWRVLESLRMFSCRDWGWPYSARPSNNSNSEAQMVVLSIGYPLTCYCVSNPRFLIRIGTKNLGSRYSESTRRVGKPFNFTFWFFNLGNEQEFGMRTGGFRDRKLLPSLFFFFLFFIFLIIIIIIFFVQFDLRWFPFFLFCFSLGGRDWMMEILETHLTFYVFAFLEIGEED